MLLTRRNFVEIGEHDQLELLPHVKRVTKWNAGKPERLIFTIIPTA